MRPSRALAALGTAVLVAVGCGSSTGLSPFGGHGTRITAYFDRTVGLYAGSDLRVLGVKVGSVDSVRPQGTRVAVTMTVDQGIRVPADASAVLVAPSLVADRYVQLTPAWTGGPVMPDHGTIPQARTAVPVEIDQLYASLGKLAQALGPQGANADGALSALLDTGAANLRGNGSAIGDSIAQFGAAARTLNGSSSQLFATLGQLQSFTGMLKQHDTQVRSATERLATVSGFLAADRQDLADALAQLATALAQVEDFVRDNRAQLSSAVAQLLPITQTLANRRASLGELLDTAPLAADNLLAAYNPATGAISGRADLNELSLPVPFGLAGGGR